jgi:hypothetical protein
MRRTDALVLAVVVLLAMSGAASASAAEWLLNGAVVGAATAASGEGTIKLEDQGLNAGLECAVRGSGKVGPGLAGKLELVEFKECKALKSCTVVDSVEAVNLPWAVAVELVETEGDKYFVLISAGSAGNNPGYLIACVFLGMLLEDMCTKEAIKAELRDLATDVEDLFNTKEKANCTRGGKEKGETAGSQLVSVPGKTLQVSG